MQGPVTRTFFRTTKGAQQFLEISFDGLEVEVVTGKVGAAGRASNEHFASLVERDAFIAKRIERALRDGFVEGMPSDVPAPEPHEPSESAEGRGAEGLEKHRGTAYVPLVSEDDERRGSKFGGTPWLEDHDAWPTCKGCTQPLRFVLQLARADVPEWSRWAFRSDFLQLFLCDAVGKPGDPGWLCQAQEGSRPFAPSTCVRHVSSTSGPSDIRESLPLAALDLRRRCGLESMVSYCRRVGDEDTARIFEARIETESVDPKAYDVPANVEEFTRANAILFPAQRIVEWRAEVDVPAYGDVELDELEELEARFGLRCLAIDKLGGFPRWAQDPEVPACPKCRTKMRYLMQVVTNGNVPIGVGGDGLGWVFACAACSAATFTWQS